MKIKSVDFIKSSAKVDQCPDSDRFEYAFVGRSNVGKSSLVNMLTDRKKMAMTSGNPGKTKLINHFLVNDDWYLVDLPGYGYAKVSKKERVEFDRLIRYYLQHRENLTCLFLLIDCRHEPIGADVEFINWLGAKGIPFVIVFTKADKLSKNQLEVSVNNYKSFLLSQWEELPPVFISSSSTSRGRNEILEFIDLTNKQLSPHN
jgi:GTP-binding protein